MDADIALHFNPRYLSSGSGGLTVLNTKQRGEWQAEEKQPLCVMQEDGSAFKAFSPGQTVQIVVRAEANLYQVCFRKGFSDGAALIDIT